jgi:hypothetical protein
MIVIEGAALESSLEWAIWGLLGMTTDVGQLFTLRQSFEVKVNTFTRVVATTVKDPDLRKTGADLARRLRDSSKRRNSVIHAIWPAHNTMGGKFALSTKLGEKAIRLDTVSADRNDLTAVAAVLKADFIDLCVFLDAVPFFKAPYTRADASPES